MEEVHRWRGTAEQRARSSQSYKSGQFAYFDLQLDHPDWRGKAVLDFGGNTGNLLADSDGRIQAQDYYCVDVIKEALDEGHARVPSAHWIHYNRYNCSFNPDGIIGMPVPDMGVEFGMILAYSVFTHTTREEMHELVRQLREKLAPDGVLAFTFIDPHWNSWPAIGEGTNLKWRLERAREVNPNLDLERMVRQSQDAEWCALVDGTELYVNNNGVWSDKEAACMTYNVYYTAQFMEHQFPMAAIRPPVNGEMQHCCIIQRDN